MDFFNGWGTYLSEKYTNTVNSLESSMESLIVSDREAQSSDDSTVQPENRDQWIDYDYWKKARDQTLFTVTLGYNLMTHNSETMPWWNIINEYLVLGALPFQDDVDAIADLGVGGVLTLNQPFELEPNQFGVPASPEDWQRRHVRNLIISTPDFHAPTVKELEGCLEFMKEIVDAKKKVYVHCKAGRGRSVVASVCFLIKYEQMSWEEATAYIKKRRPQINMGSHQTGSCANFEKIHGMPKGMRTFTLLRLAQHEQPSPFFQMPDDLLNHIVLFVDKKPDQKQVLPDFSAVKNFFSEVAESFNAPSSGSTPQPSK
jgi:protein tyrosine phosphatase (PTP) superfamily phosphohydrolase (DUF442 family)